MYLCRLNLEQCKTNRTHIISIFEDILVVNSIASGNQAGKMAVEKEIEMEKYIDDNSAYVVAAFDEGVLIGFAWFYERYAFNERRFHLTEIGVADQYRGKGIARQMILSGINEAESREIKAVELFANTDNYAAISLYESIGFEKSRIHFVKRV